MGYAALLVYLFLLFIRPMEWVPGLDAFSIMDPVMALLFMTWIPSIDATGWRPREAPQNFLVLGLFVATLASNVIPMSPISRFPSPYLGSISGMDGFIGTFILFGKVILLFLFVSSLLDTPKRIRGALYVMGAGVLFMSFHAILQMKRGYGFGSGENSLPFMQSGPHGLIPRAIAFGFFSDPNDLALILVAAMPFFLRTVFRRGGNPLGRFIGIGCMFPLTWALIATGSRGGWLAFGMMGAAFVGMNLPSRFGRKLALVTGGAIFVFIVFLAPGRMGNLSSGDASSRGRWAAWGDGTRMFKSSPLVGVGKGRFDEFSDDSRMAHNSFVHCYAELGLFGYFFWMAAIFACLYDGIVLARTEFEDEEGADLADIAKAAVPALTGYLAAGFFLSRTYTHPLYILFGVIAALHTIAGRRETSVPRLFVLRDNWKKILLICLVSILGIYILTGVLMRG